MTAENADYVKPPDPVTLPCGCLIVPTIEHGIRTLKISPCRLDCVNLRNAVDMAGEASKPVEYREGP